MLVCRNGESVPKNANFNNRELGPGIGGDGFFAFVRAGAPQVADLPRAKGATGQCSIRSGYRRRRGREHHGEAVSHTPIRASAVDLIMPDSWRVTRGLVQPAPRLGKVMSVLAAGTSAANIQNEKCGTFSLYEQFQDKLSSLPVNAIYTR
jgi:hypothetical protein